MTKRKMAVMIIAMATLSFQGCIISDQLTTLMIHPDGEVDITVLRSNIHSTKSGAEAEEELAEYKQKFAKRDIWPLNRFESTEKRVLKAEWLRDGAPFANYIQAELPHAKSLEKLVASENDKNGWELKAAFDKKGTKRTLDLMITSPENNQTNGAPQNVDEMMAQLANGISQLRFAVIDGQITEATGLRVADDKQSALLDMVYVQESLQEDSKTRIQLQWEVKG